VKRKYELKARAERQAETRRRITEATVALHQEVGPARTTVAEVARRAGVTRLTVYNNFPEERELFAACQGHWFEQHPPPALDPAEGLEAVLGSLYRWYRQTARMAENVRRDRALVPELDAVMRETGDARMAALEDALGGGPMVALALDFWTWRRLAAEGLSDAEGAALMARAATIE
jgi:AcrR family transcriptional regulator